MPAIFGIVGLSNSGKTTLIERLIPILRLKGLNIGTLKHDAHGFDIDKPGKDTWRHREAGAEAVVISGPDMVAVLRRTRESQDAVDLIERYMADLDLVLVEGFKRYAFPKLEVVRAANSREPVCAPGELSALVSDLSFPDLALPVFGLDDTHAIADHIEACLRR